MTEEHPFAPYLRIIGKGPNMGRPLSFEEARDAGRMIVSDEVEPVQIGALLLLLRQRGESVDEVAGLAAGAREVLFRDGARLDVDLDWPSYADRHQQQPWYILAALLLAGEGCRILMHGIAGETDGFAPSRPVLDALGVPRAENAAEAGEHLEQQNFAYLGLEHLYPALHALFGLRPLLGVRTVINTLARALNPCEAPAQIVGVAHPPYCPVHQGVAERLGQPAAAIFKGNGEAQRNPLKPCRVFGPGGTAAEVVWPAMLERPGYRWRDEPLDPAHVAALWRGEHDNPEAEAAVIATAALALSVTGRAETPADADARAGRLWQDRDRRKFG